MGLFRKLFGTYSSRQLKKIKPTVDRIEALAPTYAAMSDADLRAQTDILKGRRAAGASLDSLLPDAFALVREAAERVLDKRPFRVQLMGGIVLHQGRIAEMKTGEGKTLVATLPAYLNALDGKGVHIVTVNEYLARTGAEEMGRVYEFLGLSCGLIVHGQNAEEKRAAYAADITYCTNNEVGFDYLRDNMVQYSAQKVQRGHAFAIVDEVDSILIDEARTPLIISGEGEESTELYDKADRFARTLTALRVKELDTKKVGDEYDADYLVDEKAKSAVLTIHGVKKAEAFFGIDNLSDAENTTIAHHINLAIRAHSVMHRDNEYVVTEDGKIMIVDAFTGRIMPGRRYSEGLHQAIEAKEHVAVQKENRTVASITFQNLFRLYGKLSGMTGTAQTEETEFREIYNLDVVVIPTNRPMIRIDHRDCIFKSMESKYRAILKQIRTCYEKGQPILVGTASIERSEELSKLLRREKIPHTVLNAKFHEKEAEIVASAGTRFQENGEMRGTVTIATNMAGRGTDIMLGGNPEFLARTDLRAAGIAEEVILQAAGSAETDDAEVLAVRKQFRELFEQYKAKIAPEAEAIRAVGGLYILGTERHESRRIDNQLRGRAGRQGDPGESSFYISLEDDLLRRFGDNRMMAFGLQSLADKMTDDQALDVGLAGTFVERAQRAVEGRNFASRKHVLSYDDVLNQQRKLIYNQRDEVLAETDISEKIAKMTHEMVASTVIMHTAAPERTVWNCGAIVAALPLLCTADDFAENGALAKLSQAALIKALSERADAFRAEKRSLYGEELMAALERKMLLRHVDLKWMEHLENMEDLRDVVQLQVYAQRDPLGEYRMQGAELFDNMALSVREDTAHDVLAIRLVAENDTKRSAVVHIVGEGFEGDEADLKRKKKAQKKRAAASAAASQPMRKEKTPEPNDPCPCGSGKKYKRCCALRTGGETES